MARDRLYILRARLTWAKSTWREIAIRGDQTLHDLHRGILDAFEWTQDDNYRFHISDDILNLSGVYESGDPKHDPYKTRLDDLDLEEEGDFFYIFSDGDRNLFRIRVMSIETPEAGILYPDVVDEGGESPEQDLAYLDE